MNTLIIDAVFLGSVVILCIVVIALTLISVFNARRAQKLGQQMRRLRRSSQPGITVLVYAHNQAATVNTTLAALLRSDYHYYDIVVIDDRSTDDTTRQVKWFISKHPSASIRLLRKRLLQSYADVLRSGYRKSQRGEVVVALPAEEEVTTSLLKQAAVRWKEQPAARTMFLPSTPSVDTLSDIIHSLHRILWRRRRRAAAFSASYLMQSKSTASPSHSRNDYWQHVLFGVVILTVLGLAVLLQSPKIVWYGWLLVTAWLVALVWLDEQGSVATKMRLTFASPPAFLLLPVSSVIKAVSQFLERK